MGFKLTRICSEFSYGDWIVHQFGVKDGERIHKTKSFRDYFYFNEETIGNLTPYAKVEFADSEIYNSLYGEKTRKIKYTSIKEKNAIRDSYCDETFELDVKPEFKFLMERNMTWADASERHIAYFDIETWAEGNEFHPPESPLAFITSIQVYSTMHKKYFMFTWHHEETEHLVHPEVQEKDDKVYVFCKDEEQVLMSFLTFVTEDEVDLLTGWNSSQYDIPYIIGRAKMLNIDTDCLSPIRRISNYQKMHLGRNVWNTYIEGLDHIDMLEAVDSKFNYNLPNLKLETAAKEILKDRDSEKITDVTWKDWPTDFKGFMRYGFRDVQILKELDETLGIFDYYCTVQNLSNITKLADINHNTEVIDKYILTECHGEYVFPTQRTKEKIDYMGAHVVTPVPGLYEDVGVVDYASLYPTAIMSFNLSPETFICSGLSAKKSGLEIEDVVSKLEELNVGFVDTGECDELFGERYIFYGQEKKVGLLPRVLKKLFMDRKAIQAKMKPMEKIIKAGEADNELIMQHNALDKRQYAIKIILNSAYGAFGFNFFRLYKPEVADAITFFARQALKHAIDELNHTGFNVVYGDTDSCFFKQNGQSGEVQKWVDNFNRGLGSMFIPKYNSGIIDEYRMMDLEYEKDLERIYFGPSKKDRTVGSKKRYYGIEKETGKKYIKGLNIIRKDAPTFLKTKLDELSEASVRGSLTVEMLSDLRTSIEEVPYDQIGIPKKFGKNFSEYIKTKPQALTASLWANEMLGTNIGHTDIPYLFYIESTCQDDLAKGKRQKAICLVEEDLKLIDERKDIFVLDYKTFFQKQVLDQLKEFDKIELVANVLEEHKKEMKK